MLSIQQLIKALKNIQRNAVGGEEFVKSIKYIAVVGANNANETNSILPLGTTTTTNTLVTSLYDNDDDVEVAATSSVNNVSPVSEQQSHTNNHHHFTYASNYKNSSQLSVKQQHQQQTLQPNFHASHNKCFSLYSSLNTESSKILYDKETFDATTTQDSFLNKATAVSYNTTSSQLYANSNSNSKNNNNNHLHSHQQQQRSQRIQNFYQQQIFHQFHTQHNQNLKTKQKQTQFAMSSLAAADPLTLQETNGKKDNHDSVDSESSSASCPDTRPQNSSTGKPCFNTGLPDILQFMELIGNLKHTKRTGWVLRDVHNCESISGHMYRMSILTFLLDGSEGLNQIRCMELALVHDLAESLVGDITPFCGVSKEEKKNMELKAMEDICKLIEPRGKRMMELFEEYEHGESAESKFVKDLDRLDMVMQAFEYEKRDNCLLKHQEFFDSTEGKFNHPFVKKLVNEIYEQRDQLAKAKGAVPPPKIEVPNMDAPTTHKTTSTNGHCPAKAETTEKTNEPTKSS